MDQKRGERRKLFVENRVKKIRRKLAISNWRLCPSELNPADVTSCGVAAKQIITGPEMDFRS